MIKDMMIKEYIDKLSSTDSMPGGGAAAGLTLSQGMSLILKVCNLTIGKEKYKKYEDLIKLTIEKSEILIDNFYDLIEEDINSFKNIEDAYKMKNETDEDKKIRKEKMEKACIVCLEAPIKMIEKGKEGILLAKNIIGKSNQSASSDVTIGIELMKAGAISAYQNVLINKKSINDEKALERCEKSSKLIEEIKNM